MCTDTQDRQARDTCLLALLFLLRQPTRQTGTIENPRQDRRPLPFRACPAGATCQPGSGRRAQVLVNRFFPARPRVKSSASERGIATYNAGDHLQHSATAGLAVALASRGRRDNKLCRILRLLFVPAVVAVATPSGTDCVVHAVPVRKAEIAAVRDGLVVSPARGPFTHRGGFCWCLFNFHFLF